MTKRILLSRRNFLRLAGIAVAAAYLPARLNEAVPSFEPTYGRALTAAPIYAAPDDAESIAHLWPDSVTPILTVRGGWLRLPSGYARRQDLQPMITPAHRRVSASQPPFWAEVGGAVAIVRAYCAANAPIITRIGHGGVLRVIDCLPTDGLDWYGLADEHGDLFGWSQAADWQPATADHAAANLMLQIDAANQKLVALDDDHVVLSAPISTGSILTPGQYQITWQQISTASDHSGVPWSLGFGDFDLSGVYWHNQFGAPTPGAAVQITPPLAKWLYPRAESVIVF